MRIMRRMVFNSYVVLQCDPRTGLETPLPGRRSDKSPSSASSTSKSAKPSASQAAQTAAVGSLVSDADDPTERLGPLPAGWEQSIKEGRIFFIDHSAHSFSITGAANAYSNYWLQ